MPTESAPLTVFDAVRRAVNACDPDATSAAGADALARFEDRDEPLAGLEGPTANWPRSSERSTPKKRIPRCR